MVISCLINYTFTPDWVWFAETIYNGVHIQCIILLFYFYGSATCQNILFCQSWNKIKNLPSTFATV